MAGRDHFTRWQDYRLKMEILNMGEYGVLATVMDDGKPYSIPLNYALDEESQVIYMHCSAEGGQIGFFQGWHFSYKYSGFSAWKEKTYANLVPQIEKIT